nr:hypothetical protein [Pseudodesulfovibrio sp.]
METKLSQFARRGGTGEFLLVQQDGQTFGQRLDLVVKAEFIANDFRKWCKSKGIPLDGGNIKKQFESFCRRARI